MDVHAIAEKVSSYHCLKDPAVEIPALIEAFGLTRARRFLEIGTWRGATSAAMRLAYPEAQIWTVDLPNPEKAKFNPQGRASTGLAHRELGLSDTIKQLWMDSSNLSSMAGEVDFDMIFVDGDHSYEGCLSDLRVSAPLLVSDGVLVVHDYTEKGVDPEPRPHWTVWVESAVNKFLNEQASSGICWDKQRLPGWLLQLRRPCTCDAFADGPCPRHPEGT